MASAGRHKARAGKHSELPQFLIGSCFDGACLPDHGADTPPAEAGTFISMEELLRLLNERGLDPGLPSVAEAIAEYGAEDGQGVHVPTADPENILTKASI